MRRMERLAIIAATCLIFGISGYAVFQSNEPETSAARVIFFAAVIIAAGTILPVVIGNGKEK